MATNRVDNSSAFGLRNSSSAGKTAPSRRKQSSGTGESQASPAGNDAAVKVELSEEGKRLAAKVTAGADSEGEGIKLDAPSLGQMDHPAKLSGAEQEFENLVQYYAKKISKAARALDRKEGSTPATARSRKDDLDEIG